MDLLDGGERARLDEIGNRAVLTSPRRRCGFRCCSPPRWPDPEAVAVTFEGRAMSYRELDEGSKRLAHCWWPGVGPGRVWALLFTLHRVDSGDLGGDQDRGGLCAGSTLRCGGTPDRYGGGSGGDRRGTTTVAPAQGRDLLRIDVDGPRGARIRLPTPTGSRRWEWTPPPM